ncbi:hypothetical protein ACWIF8_02025 [Micromonospora chalcea]|uniref:TipAS antibiotic-recognition domain-containing protein n=1 Tax=Micromonospora echinospora TaxID=1877 RepID=A0ABR6MAX1_MICEC|nr:hypothetical protein [Micromonospora echinospora]MBB5112525.1 hypothetical protein [Micromonospora echinospora]
MAGMTLGTPLRMRIGIGRLFGRFMLGGSPTPRPFRPQPVDPEAARREIDRYVDRLAPEAIDECTGHALDNLINARADAWLAELAVHYAEYQVDVERYLAAADAVVAWQGALTRYYYQRYEDLTLAHDFAHERLAGGYQGRPR